MDISPPAMSSTLERKPPLLFACVLSSGGNASDLSNKSSSAAINSSCCCRPLLNSFGMVDYLSTQSWFGNELQSKCTVTSKKLYASSDCPWIADRNGDGVTGTVK
jgi:hypothetical protein